jgi:CRP-like cAMP-binding protein
MSGEFLLKKLAAFGSIPAASSQALIELGHNRTRTVKARSDIISEGDDPKDIYLITKGWAARYKMLEDGSRQIVGLFVPGDLCDLHVYVLKQMDHSIGSLTALTFARISAREMDDLCDAHPRIVRALWWDALVQSSIQHEWMLSVGQRDAYESLAHLCCEMFFRLRAIGLTQGNSCALPLTQQDIADSLGLTETHVGRMVKKLNQSGAATFSRRRLEIHDMRKLQDAGRFNPNYLHRTA